jgi:hypothetical protein
MVDRSQHLAVREMASLVESKMAGGKGGKGANPLPKIGPLDSSTISSA